MASEEIHTQIHREASETPQQQHIEDEVIINIKKRLQDCRDGGYCIYRVPNTLRNFKEEAYVPKVVSIGPFHYGSERLQDMEKHKQIVFKRFIEKAMSSLDDLVPFVRHLEPEVRGSYSETIELSKQEFVEMTLMDAGFIIEFFLMLGEMHDVEDNYDAKLSQRWSVGSILDDLILIENQLPFFIIEGIYNKAVPHDRCSSLPSFLTCICEGFKHIIPYNLVPSPNIEVRHFTDLFRLFHLEERMLPSRQSFSKSHVLCYSANDLQEAGIKLKTSTNTTSLCLLDFKFSGHNLEIPQFLLNDRTEILFHNMIAFEQCHYPGAAYITDYVTVLKSLIRSHKDVQLLLQKEIVKSSMGDSYDVEGFLNGLVPNVAQLNFNSEYLYIWKSLHDYCEDPWNKMMASWRRWRTTASIAGITILILTIVQTICSILQIVLNK